MIDPRSILVRQIGERADQLRLRMLWDLTAENVPEQEAWDIEHPRIIVQDAAPRAAKTWESMSPSEFVIAMSKTNAPISTREALLAIFEQAIRNREMGHIEP